MERILFAAILFQIIPLAQGSTVNDSAGGEIPEDVTRIVLPELRYNKRETAGPEAVKVVQAKARTDEFYCGYRVRLEEPLRNARFDISGISLNGAQYFASAASRSASGSIKINIDSRYVKKSYFGETDEQTVKDKCQSSGWSMTRVFGGKAPTRPDAAFECRGGVMYCRSISGSYHACGQCPG